MVHFLLTDARTLLSGLNASRTPSTCALLVASSLPVATSHHLIVPSMLPDARVLPSPENANATQPLWSDRDASSLPVATLHSLIFPSLLPEAIALLSDVNAMDTRALCSSLALSVKRFLNVIVSQSMTASPLEDTSTLSLGLKRRVVTRFKWPLSVSRSLPLTTSHTLMVPSSSPETNVLPSE